MSEEKQYQITVSESAVKMIIAGLAELPYKFGGELIKGLEKIMVEQNTPKKEIKNDATDTGPVNNCTCGDSPCSCS
jgi:hypothetical protein